MTKFALPQVLPSRDDADHTRLVIEPGPWTEDRWAVVDGVGDFRRMGGGCSVADCERNRYVRKVNLCQPHWHQWRRAGEPEDVEDWAQRDARVPQERNRPDAVSTRIIDFTAMPPLVATEIRYVVGRKILAGDWTPNRALLEFLLNLTTVVSHDGAQSLLDRRPEDWNLLIQQRANKSQVISAKSYSRTFFGVLHRALTLNPWADDHWLYKDCMDRLVHRSSQSENGQNINWARITQEWLREPLKAHAKESLITGRRAWGTVITWAQGFTTFSEYISDEGIEDPIDVDRSLFLDYLVYLHEHGASKSALSKANTVAALLAVLHDLAMRSEHSRSPQGVSLGAEIFLFYGENAVQKTREPKPYPDDVVARIDSLVLKDPALHPSAREMLQLTRWGGLRIAELVTLPLDCVVANGNGGYWVRYWMTKVKDWRRFPIPDDLAQRLLRQQKEVRETYGPEAAFMFPSPARSNPSALRALPWSPSGFRRTVAASFTRNDITHSTITGETVSGGSIHRYRHTIGTTLLNNGWTQGEVKQFLGHATETMTSAYAAILDDTLSRKFREFHTQQEAERVAAGESVLHPGVEALRHKFVFELADGGCTLPANQHCDVRDNPCSGCAFFSLSDEGRAVQEARRTRLKLHIEQATNPAEVALNQEALDAVKKVLAARTSEDV